MSKIIVLKKAPAIAPRGKQQGVFIDTKQNAGTDEFGTEYNNLLIKVELKAKDKGGQSLYIEKSYNLLGRGVSAFSDDFKSWNRRSLTPDELEGFNPDDLLKDKGVVVDIAHRKQGKETVAYIAGFHPVEKPEVVAS